MVETINYINGVSIIICCYNSSARIARTLEGIANQSLPVNLKVELILVDNNCKDDTVAVVLATWDKFNSSIPLTIVEESIPGLSSAREKGVQTCIYRYVLFCDDDNYLDENYVANSFRLMQEKEMAILGGYGSPVYEIDPPDWFIKNKIQHAVGEQGKGTEDITAKKGCVFGAGMVVDKYYLDILKEMGFKNVLTDRKGTQLSSGGDTELCFATRLVGGHIYYSDTLRFDHFFPKERLTWDYNKRIYFAGGKSYASLVIYEFLYENPSGSYLKSTFCLMKELMRYLSKKYRSPKRLYFYWFKERVGEEYFLNYKFNSGMISGLIHNLFFSNYFKINKWLSRTSNQN